MPVPLQTTIILSLKYIYKAIHDVIPCCCQAQHLVDMHTIVGIECGQAQQNHESLKALGFVGQHMMDSTLVKGAV